MIQVYFNVIARENVSAMTRIIIKPHTCFKNVAMFPIPCHV